MSKSVSGKKRLHLTASLLVGSGLVLTLTQSLDEHKLAGKSMAELRQQAWTYEIFSGKSSGMRGSSFDLADPAYMPDPLATGSIASASMVTAGKDAVVHITEIVKDDPHSAARIKQTSDLALAHAGEGLVVDRSSKGDRRQGWSWEPYHVAHGRKAIALNWSGSLYSLNSLFSTPEDKRLPKLAFLPRKNARIVMADANAFAPPPVYRAPASQIAKATPQKETLPGKRPQADAVAAQKAGTTALAYAPTSVAALEEPFRAILTEQRTGQISEDNQVTVLGAVEQSNAQEAANNEQQLASAPVTPLTALPRVKPGLPAQKSKKSLKVGKPLDTTAVVAKLTKTKPTAKSVKATSVSLQKAKQPSKTKARQAELKLASLSTSVKPEQKKKKSRFANWFSFGKKKAKKAKIVTRGEHAWVSNKLPKSTYSKKQRTCLANAIYFESRSEPQKGQIAVAQVVVNRVKNPTYPNTICGVVYQNKHKRNACQFSFACDRIRDRILSKKSWDLAVKLANQVIDGEVWLKDVGSSTHYHATYVRPKWAKTMKRRKKIGLHIFYKTYGGGWS